MIPSIPGALADFAFFMMALDTIVSVMVRGAIDSGGYLRGSHDGDVDNTSGAANTSVKKLSPSVTWQSGGSDPIALPQIMSANFLGFVNASLWCLRIFCASIAPVEVA